MRNKGNVLLMFFAAQSFFGAGCAERASRDYAEQMTVNLIRYEDAMQGLAGDGYLIAPLCAVAKSDPDAIYEIMENDGSGGFRMRLYTGGKDNLIAQAEEDRVYLDVPVNFPADEDGEIIYAANGAAFHGGGTGRHEIWAMLIEKAFALYHKSYEALDTGGDPGKAMEMLTGRETKYYATVGMQGEEVIGLIEDSLARGKAIVAAAPQGEETDEELSVPLLRGHFYAVIGAGNGRIELYNPHGARHPRPLTGGEFKNFFSWVFINER
ncbi:MAG: hypothetical protein FJ088_01250 [Deltaproteobacteria bacterium]|nr:hypothetical protein [Deltaproteobacteria bacterium]